MSIDVLNQPFALAGRVVTMDSDRAVIDDGVVYIRGGDIVAVRPAGEPAPVGFEAATVIAAGGTIYPGLIELHNHLPYNAMPLWQVSRRYANNGQWRSGVAAYKKLVSKPSAVLGMTSGVVDALVRYVECRALMGGVTSSQGITLCAASGIQKYFKGLIRNVESPLDPRQPGGAELPSVRTCVENPPTSASKLGKYHKDLRDGAKPARPLLHHLAEGIDDTARGWFLRLRKKDGSWAINHNLCGIHLTALEPEDFAIMASNGGSMVWSPLSNYLLYGDTADLRAVKDSGITVALGSDWAPSGSKNLLGELKVAWLASAEQGGDQPIFSPRELVEMVTVNPATMIRWDGRLGSVEAGKLADLVVVRGVDGDPYEHLLRAREQDLSAVFIDGVPRVGEPSVMNLFALDPVDTVPVGDSRRTLYLESVQPGEFQLGVSLSAAIDVLRGAMNKLPQLAWEIDSTDPGQLAGGLVGADGVMYRVLPDFDLEDEALDRKQFEHSGFEFDRGFSAWVQPMSLPGLTVADDPEHLRGLVQALNLPDFVKAGLPPLYGQTVDLPTRPAPVEEPGSLPEQVQSTIGPLSEFLRTFGELSLDDRRLIVDQALRMLEGHYVHLPLKRAMHAVAPVQRLRLLSYRLEQQSPATMGPELDFHRELSACFTSLRDLHTGYRLPWPYATKIAWLPFFVEEYEREGERAYMVSKVVKGIEDEHFTAGVRITHWNGMPMSVAVARNADTQAGSNPDARHARGLNSLTIRPLSQSVPPDEDWVTIRYVDDDTGEAYERKQEWLVFEPGANLGPDLEALTGVATAIGVDEETDGIQQVRKLLFAPEIYAAEQAAGSQIFRLDAGGLAPGEIKHSMRGVFRARRITDPDGDEYGYIRVYTFSVSDADEFLSQFVAVLEKLPDRGLVLDVRGNPGGLIPAAERLLQLFTPRRIQPELAQFINTPLNLNLCRKHAPSKQFEDFDLSPWIPSIRNSVWSGDTYSKGVPITDPARCTDIGQRYYGPVVLIVDPLCYSATDMFAAGFQDHGVGDIIGVFGNTGAGGANVWSHNMLRLLMEPDDDHADQNPFVSLPHGAGFRVAVRRTVRVAGSRGDILEDSGVTPDVRYRMTKADLLDGNRDLLRFALWRLRGKPVHAIRVEVGSWHGDAPAVRVDTIGVDRLDVKLSAPDGGPPVRWLHTVEVGAEPIDLDLGPDLRELGRRPVRLELVGYQRTTDDDRSERLVARRIEHIEPD
ncbi:amidohydrolase family protein [Haliangium sp.]|uniref:amidohydrolase family protein n=1 Tax=Haliangium sp. TaxID=2663208 RepID=UPI003D0C18DB